MVPGLRVSGSGVHEVVPKILVELNAEVSEYVEELLPILNSLAFDGRDWDQSADSGAKEIMHRRRLRELVVLLKGNDVWTDSSTTEGTVRLKI
jgi:hypothetical protein